MDEPTQPRVVDNLFFATAPLFMFHQTDGICMRSRHKRNEADVKAHDRKIVDLFCSLLPFVDERFAFAFDNNMCDYRERYQTYADSPAPYEQTQPYRDEASAIIIASSDDTWVYAPQFKRLMARTLEWLFATRITHLSESNSMGDVYLMVFVDGTARRWAVAVDRVAEAVHVSIRMPISNTCIAGMQMVPKERLVDPEPLVLSCTQIDPS